jgi:hypothetical protein
MDCSTPNVKEAVLYPACFGEHLIAAGQWEPRNTFRDVRSSRGIWQMMIKICDFEHKKMLHRIEGDTFMHRMWIIGIGRHSMGAVHFE